MKSILNEILISFRALFFFGLLLCGVYPLLIWGIGQTVFTKSANGSLLRNREGIVIGSNLIAQSFTDSSYFHPRPSAAGNGYDATASGGSNLGPLSRKLADQLQSRSSSYRTMNRLDNNTPIPADAVTASASGLDPDISIKNAILQAPRVAEARHLEPQTVVKLIHQQMIGRQFGLLGEPRVNVLKLNLSLDRIPR
jgi:potassium-transporting ATPase KdpC subunit